MKEGLNMLGYEEFVFYPFWKKGNFVRKYRTCSLTWSGLQFKNQANQQNVPVGILTCTLSSSFFVAFSSQSQNILWSVLKTTSLLGKYHRILMWELSISDIQSWDNRVTWQTLKSLIPFWDVKIRKKPALTFSVTDFESAACRCSTQQHEEWKRDWNALLYARLLSLC